MQYWEIVADKLSASGWSWGYCSAVTRDRWRWIVDTHREGRRYIVHSEERGGAVMFAQDDAVWTVTSIDAQVSLVTRPGSICPNLLLVFENVHRQGG